MSDLETAAEALLDKLEKAKPAIHAVCTVADIHGSPYNGPNWAQEAKALRIALQLSRNYTGGADSGSVSG